VVRLDFPVGQYGQRKALSFSVYKWGWWLLLVGPFKFARHQPRRMNRKKVDTTYKMMFVVVKNSRDENLILRERIIQMTKNIISAVKENSFK